MHVAGWLVVVTRAHRWWDASAQVPQAGGRQALCLAAGRPEDELKRWRRSLRLVSGAVLTHGAPALLPVLQAQDDMPPGSFDMGPVPVPFVPPGAAVVPAAMPAYAMPVVQPGGALRSAAGCMCVHVRVLTRHAVPGTAATERRLGRLIWLAFMRPAEPC